MEPTDSNDGEKRDLIRVGGQVDESSATLRISGDDLDPDEITKLLEFPPTVARRKGDVRLGKRSMNEYTARTGQWHLETPRGEGDLDNHIRWILDALCSDLEVWGSIGKKYEIDLFCGLFLHEWNQGTGICSELMLGLGERGIDLSLDIYCSLPEED